MPNIAINSDHIKEIIRDGVDSGIHKFFRFFIIIILAIMMLNWSMFHLFDYGKDSTDGVSPSGLSIKIDNLTGCQYLSSTGLTPRLDYEGNHIGCKPYLYTPENPEIK